MVVNRADLLSPAQVAAMITTAEKKDQPHSPARPWLAQMPLIAAGSGMRVSELGGCECVMWIFGVGRFMSGNSLPRMGSRCGG